jgi:hypothetical protein
MSHPELQAWGRIADERDREFRAIVSTIKELETKLTEITADRDSEKQTRKNWMKRATEVESRAVRALSSAMFLL